MFSSLQAAITAAESQGSSLARVALDAESRDQGRPVDDIRSALHRALDIMRGAVDRGMRGDLRSVSGLVGGDAAKLREGPPGPLAGTLFRDVLARALAVQEVNAAMGVIVAAPTAGGAGVLPHANEVDALCDDLKLFTQADGESLPSWESDAGERLVYDETFGQRQRLLKRFHVDEPLRGSHSGL